MGHARVKQVQKKLIKKNSWDNVQLTPNEVNTKNKKMGNIIFKFIKGTHF